MTIKEPLDVASVKAYTPMPAKYPPAKGHRKYIVIDLGEQWLGAYEFGKLKFSMPAASGTKGHETPTGLFRWMPGTVIIPRPFTKPRMILHSIPWIMPFASILARITYPTGSMPVICRGSLPLTVV